MTRVDLIIIGGGILGSATAFFASRAGLKVALIEQRASLAAHMASNCPYRPCAANARLWRPISFLPTRQWSRTTTRERTGVPKQAARFWVGRQVRISLTLMDTMKSNLTFDIGSKPAALTLVLYSARLEFLPGQGGLEIMQIRARFTAPLELGASPLTIQFRDDNYRERLGWREIVAKPYGGVNLAQLPRLSKD